MLNQEKPREYVLSSNETHSVKEFVELSCKYADLNYKWIENDNEMDTKLFVDNIEIMNISEKFYRPSEVDLLYGDSTETRKKLNWKPKISFKELVKKMTEHDMKLVGIKFKNSI
jgi:GDPmannose 4,6-dehydratase